MNQRPSVLRLVHSGKTGHYLEDWLKAQEDWSRTKEAIGRAQICEMDTLRALWSTKAPITSYPRRQRPQRPGTIRNGA